MNVKKYSEPLKAASMLLGVVGFFVANEIQKRETREIVEEVLAEREANPPPEVK